MSNQKIPNRFLSLLNKRCPNCHRGNLFTNKRIFPLGHMLDMPEHCPVCGQKYEIEIGFWYGTGYVSYALSVGLIAVIAILFSLTVGFSWQNNSVFWFIGVMIVAMILLQPIIMRYSRVLYIYFFVKYGEGTKLKSSE